MLTDGLEPLKHLYRVLWSRLSPWLSTDLEGGHRKFGTVWSGPGAEANPWGRLSTVVHSIALVEMKEENSACINFPKQN